MGDQDARPRHEPAGGQSAGDEGAGPNRRETFEPSGADTASARARAAHETATDEMDDHAATAGITIRPGRGVETIFVTVPGMAEFETTPGELMTWLREHKLVPTQRQMSAIEERLTRILLDGQKITHRGGDGHYDWDDYGQHWDQHSEQWQEQQNELQSQDWGRMTRAWEQFHQQLTDLRTIADGDGDEIVRQVGHTITALNMIVSEEWAPFCYDEFAEWERLATTDIPAEHFHAAARAIVEAGEHLYEKWQNTLSAGDYHSFSMSPHQTEFIQHCAEARVALRP